MATESFEIIHGSLSWPTRLSRTRVSSVQGLSLSETPSLASLNLDDVLRTVQHLGLKQCLYSDIENLNQVGEGESFRVDKCIYDRQTVAVKHIKLGASQSDNHGLDRRLRAVLSEIRIMYHAPLREHPNVLSILGYGWRQSGPTPMPYIVVEYAMFGSLRQYLAESERSLRTKIIMAGDIAAGLNALHQCEIVHGDLKLDNVVVLQSWDRPPGTIAKICDFGHAIVLSGDKRQQKYYGTALYNPPEVQYQDLPPIGPVDLPKCDMWAYGLALWEIFQNGETFFKKSWRDETTCVKICSESFALDAGRTADLPVDASTDLVFDASHPESEESARTLFKQFDPMHLAKLATEFINSIKFGGGFVDKAILRKFLDRALQVDPRNRPSKITLGPLMSTWNPADVNSLRAKLSIHTGSAGWSFNLLRPDQEKEIIWEHQSQILQDFEQISKRHKSPEEAAAAAFQVAMCYLSGFGVKKDVRAATNFFQEAEKCNHPAAKLFGCALQPNTFSFKQLNGSPSYETRVINGLKAAHNMGAITSLTIQWKTLDSKPVDLSQTVPPQDLPPRYQELTSGDIVEYSNMTRTFPDYTDFRRWLIGSAKDEMEPFLLTPETTVTSVPASFKANLLEFAIIMEDKLLVTMLSTHISLSIPGYLGDLPLITTCRTGNMDVLKVCLAGESDPFGKQPDGSTFFHWIFMLGPEVRHIFESPKLLKRVEGKKIFDTACVAIKDLHPQWPLQLVGSPLAFSVAACSFTGVAALLRLGANPLSPIHDSDHDSGKDCWTPLHMAVKYHSSELLVLLLLGLPKHEADLDADILATVKARVAKLPSVVEILGGKKSPLARALTNPRIGLSFTNLWDATIGCALSYSTTAERIAIHGAHYEARLTETIALLPSSCILLSSKSGKTPLMQAIDFNDLSVVVALLMRFPKLVSKAFIDPLDGQFTFPIHFASQIAGRRDADDSLDVIKALLRLETGQISFRDSRGKSPLHYSVTGSSDRATKLLIEKGCSVSAADDQGQTALHSAQSAKNLVALLDASSFIDQQDKAGRAPIHTAVPPGSEDLVKVLVDRGANLNLKDNLGQTALHCAVVRRSRDVCAILLDAGADVNTRTSSGDTPLHLAIQSTRNDIVKLLLDNGADIAVTGTNAFTALHQSVFIGDYICFNQVLGSVQRQDSALLNTIDLKQQTPLHIAAKFARVGIAEKLLQYGAEADLVDGDGNTAFHLAVQSDLSLGHTQADRVDFLALLYTHWMTTCGPDNKQIDVITAQLNSENFAGETAWDLAYEQKEFMVMDFLIVKGGFEICRQLHMDGEYVGNRLLDYAIDVDEWDLVVTLLRHETVLAMHPKFKDAPSEDIFMALRMNDKWSLKNYLRARMSDEQEDQGSGLRWLNGNIAESKLFRLWQDSQDGKDELCDK